MTHGCNSDKDKWGDRTGVDLTIQEKRSLFEFGFIVWAIIFCCIHKHFFPMTSNVNTKPMMH
ncbi:MAG: hypothetical protein LH647_01705, partial [Leptolyngbyaceae cyanobacterium CAN_BIN12]|nr:hypothetical protein [Leptolyngbyaceae cyanobacterium CAN_BIN12]